MTFKLEVIFEHMFFVIYRVTFRMRAISTFILICSRDTIVSALSYKYFQLVVVSSTCLCV